MRVVLTSEAMANGRSTTSRTTRTRGGRKHTVQKQKPVNGRGRVIPKHVPMPALAPVNAPATEYVPSSDGPAYPPYDNEEEARKMLDAARLYEENAARLREENAAKLNAENEARLDKEYAEYETLTSRQGTMVWKSEQRGWRKDDLVAARKNAEQARLFLKWGREMWAPTFEAADAAVRRMISTCMKSRLPAHCGGETRKPSALEFVQELSTTYPAIGVFRSEGAHQSAHIGTILECLAAVVAKNTDAADPLLV